MAFLNGFFNEVLLSGPVWLFRSPTSHGKNETDLEWTWLRFSSTPSAEEARTRRRAV